jgi:hypothetical protein
MTNMWQISVCIDGIYFTNIIYLRQAVPKKISWRRRLFAPDFGAPIFRGRLFGTDGSLNICRGPKETGPGSGLERGGGSEGSEGGSEGWQMRKYMDMDEGENKLTMAGVMAMLLLLYYSTTPSGISSSSSSSISSSKNSMKKSRK